MYLKPQRLLVVSVLLILMIGLLCVFSSCHQKGIFLKSDFFYKQLLWSVIGLFAMFFMSRFDYRRLSLFIFPLGIFVTASLIFVLFRGRAIMGAQRWISFGFFSFQPSELAKFVLILVLAKYFSRKVIVDSSHISRYPEIFRELIMPFGISLVPILLVMAQPDLGTALVYLFIFFSMLFFSGAPMRYIAGLAGCGLAITPVFWHFLKDYQKSRLLVFLNPNMDPLGAGYTVIQSKIAIGSGRFFGKGWMSGTQSQLNFLPERHTDFIFSVFGEEWGFFGSIILLALFVMLIFMLLRISETAKDQHGKLLACGIASVLFFHVFINIAMNLGACPVVGLPLSLVSYGGSSLVFNMMAIGIAINVARQK